MTYRPKSDQPPHKFRHTDVVEFAMRDSWVGTRFGLKERAYSDPPPRRAVIRFKLETLGEKDINRLVEFCKENGIGARFIIQSAARIRPHPNKEENDRLMEQSHGILFEIEPVNP